MIDPAIIEQYKMAGATHLPAIAADWIEPLRAGIERNMAEPGPYAAENLLPGEQGRFFDDYCNWERIPEFRAFIFESDIADIAAELMQSETVQLFHEHVLVKEGGTGKPTPWHQDSPYYFVAGKQTVSFWIPLDPVAENTLRIIEGSHLWPKPVQPVKWLKEDNFFPATDAYIPVPDPDLDPQRYPVLEWPMAAGDAVAFDYNALHGARGNPGPGRRRAFSLRLVGDDARYVTRPGRTSPPFPGHDMSEGDRLREDWFPILRG